MRYIKRARFLFLLISLSFLGLLPLFHAGFFPIHDNEQIGRLFELNKAFVNGQIPPRLAPDLGFGYDYPLWNFYPPFVYYIAWIFYLLGFSLITSTKIMIGLGFVASGITMYLFASEYLSELGAFVAALAFLYAPYHSVDLYVRGALPEFWFFVFAPLLFWSLLKLYETENKKYLTILAVLIALSILTHDLLSMMSVPFLTLFFLYLLIKSKKKITFTIQALAASVLGFMLSAYFWLPAVFEKQYTMVNLLTEQLANYALHFVCVHQFWNSMWGYGGSILGCNDGLSFQIGKIQLLSFVLAAVLFSIKILKVRFNKYGIFILFSLMFFLSLFLQTTYSKLVWDKIQPFWYIQFPWRFLLFSNFTIAFLIGFIYLFIKNKKVHLIVAVLSISGLLYFNFSYFKPKSYLNVSDNYYTNTHFLRFVTSKMSFEYVPKGIATVASSIGNTVPAIGENNIAKSDFSVVSGNMQVKVLQSKLQDKTFVVDAKTNSLFQINVFSFPGWTVYVNGRKVIYSDKNKLKLIQITLLPGRYLVEAIFSDTPIRKIGNYLSVISICLILLTLLLKLDFEHARHK